MKKNERLIAELYFINQKKQFNLSDLMSQFSISKRTALRDITDLEALGAPIYVDKGRFGGYHILNDSSLPPLYLNQNEWHSLFLALQLFKTLNQTPFNHSYLELKNKLLAISPEKESDFNLHLDQLIQFSGFKTSTATPLLADLFQLVCHPQVVEILYNRYSEDFRLIQPIQLVLKEGYWYLNTWDLHREGFRQFRCDFIVSVTQTNHKPLEESFEELLTKYQKESNKNRPLVFKAALETSALPLFQQRKYDGVELIKEKNQYYLSGRFNLSEVPFLLSFFLSFGTQLTILSPDTLIQSFTDYLADVQQNYL